MAKRLVELDGEAWSKIDAELIRDPVGYGLPEGGREDSVVLASFNIRHLGAPTDREREIDFMARFCARCDLVSVQEVKDDLSGLLSLVEKMGQRVGSAGDFGVVVSDITGKVPGKRGAPERLAFIYRHSRVRRSDLVSDLTVDRTGTVENLLENWDVLLGKLTTYKEAREHHEQHGGDSPELHLPAFLTFVRTPHVAAFDIPGLDGEAIPFIAVNAHLVYGQQRERDAEFWALMDWMIHRLKNDERMFMPSFMLLGDFNLNFDKPRNDRLAFEKKLRAINKEAFGDPESRRVYFPFIDKHPRLDRILRSNARLNQTFDQIGFFRGSDETRPSCC